MTPRRADYIADYIAFITTHATLPYYTLSTLVLSFPRLERWHERFSARGPVSTAMATEVAARAAVLRAKVPKTMPEAEALLAEAQLVPQPEALLAEAQSLSEVATLATEAAEAIMAARTASIRTVAAKAPANMAGVNRLQTISSFLREGVR